MRVLSKCKKGTGTPIFPTVVTRRGPASRLVAAAGKVSSVEVLDSENGKAVASLTSQQVSHVNDALQRGEPATDEIWRANTQDFTLSEEDADWFWGVLGSYLGSTRVKEYLPLKEPVFDKGPKKPKEPATKP